MLGGDIRWCLVGSEARKPISQEIPTTTDVLCSQLGYNDVRIVHTVRTQLTTRLL